MMPKNPFEHGFAIAESTPHISGDPARTRLVYADGNPESWPDFIIPKNDRHYPQG